MKGAKTGDAGGHITSNEANGPSEQINYWAMNEISNRNGAWRNMEKYIRDDLKGADPTAKFKVVYTGTDWKKGRPGKVFVEVSKTKNGTTTRLDIGVHREILNP